MQDGQGLRFRDRDHTRLPTLAAQGAPRLRDIALFTIPVDSAFEVTEPFELQLLVQRSINTHDKAVIPYTLGYNLPSSYVNVEKVVVATPAAEIAPEALPSTTLAPMEDQALWISIWQMNRVSIAITVTALLVLTAIFFFQDWLVKRPVMFGWIRRGYLLFTLVWLGWYAKRPAFGRQWF